MVLFDYNKTFSEAFFHNKIACIETNAHMI